MATLSSDALQGLGSSQIKLLVPGQVQAFSSLQLGALNSAQYASLSLAQASAIAAGGSMTVAGLGAEKIPSLSTTLIKALGSAQFEAFTSVQVGALTSVQVAAIDKADLAAIGPDIAAMKAIAGLTKLTVTGLSTQQLNAALSTAQIVALTSISGIGPTTLSSNQIWALTQNSAFLQVSDRVFAKLTPLALDLNGDGVRAVGVQPGVVFDIDADGKRESTGWLSGSDAWLALDLNRNGLIDDGSELFGSGTRLPDGTKATDGFAALRALDANADRMIDARDAAFADLRVWRDGNADGKTQPGELAPLSSLGIQSLSLDATPAARLDHGNWFGLLGSYTTTDGATHELADLWLTPSNTLQAMVSGDSTRAPVSIAALSPLATGPGSLAKIQLAGEGETLKVSVADVLSFGAVDLPLEGVAGLGTGQTTGQVIGATTRMVISGNATDTVQLSDAAAWQVSGSAWVGDASYRVLTQGVAQLLIEDKVKIVAV